MPLLLLYHLYAKGKSIVECLLTSTRRMILMENFKFCSNTCKNKNLRLLEQVFSPFHSFMVSFQKFTKCWPLWGTIFVCWVCSLTHFGDCWLLDSSAIFFQNCQYLDKPLVLSFVHKKSWCVYKHLQLLTKVCHC
jgi:hypothetical protein